MKKRHLLPGIVTAVLVLLISQAWAPLLLPTGGAHAAEANAPVDFTLLDLAGKPRSLKEWSDKIVVINFWATWCGPCREEIPLLMDVQRRYGSRGVQVVGIAIDERDAVERIAADLNIGYPILLGDDHTLGLMTQYGNRFASLPFSVIVTPKGGIIARKLGPFRGDELEKYLNPAVSRRVM